MALHDHPVFGRIRVEHYDNALKMGQHAAWSMLGDKKPFDDPHWFWSDQYDMNLQMGGFAMAWDQLVFRGSVEERSFTAFYLDGGRVVGAATVGRSEDLDEARELISSRAEPSAEDLR